MYTCTEHNCSWASMELMEITAATITYYSGHSNDESETMRGHDQLIVYVITYH